MPKIAFLLVIAVGLVSGAFAAKHSVRQQGRMFSIESISIKRGDTLTFINDDNVPHNIASVTPGNEFNLGSQRPGVSTDVTFTEAGEVQVICAIHPRMKMTINVSN
jgi:plastocyanin